jgi:RimJ/RimL family protein N-acetyltransferase
MPVEIIYPTEKYFKSFCAALDQVAREQIYIEMIEAKPLPETSAFQGKLVGWGDITPSSNPRMSHRGTLGMGLIKPFRGQGLGTQLLERALNHAKRNGLEKVELTVCAGNNSAIHLYKKLGFIEVGMIRHYRKLKGQYFDCLEMEKFL